LRKFVEKEGADDYHKMDGKMINCKICGSSRTEIKHLGGEALIFCQSCTVTFLAQISAVEESTQYYESEYQITAPDYISTEKRRIFRLPEQIKLIAKLAQLKPPPAAALDIGCDKGYFLDEMRRYGYAVAGVEPSSAARNYCSNLGLDVKKNIDEITGTYDIVTLWHTLEHVGEPLEFLSRVCRCLDRNGIIAIRVPDFGCLWRKIFGPHWIWFQAHNHYFHYTAPALRRLLQRAGFEIIQIESQRPNDRLTKSAYRLAARTFKEYFNATTPLQKKIGRIYEDVTGIELWAIGAKK
jgi:SAM-dependent methyltransferase